MFSILFLHRLKKLITDEIKLIKYHMTIDKKYRFALYDMSLYETLGELVRRNLLDEAEKIRKDFKIADSSETWWHIKAKSLALGHLWDELEKFSKSKKSPIGYEVKLIFHFKKKRHINLKKFFSRRL
jgi:hypothetical protein